jgi:uncharacterized protein
MQNVIITGATGFIGKRVVKRLYENNFNITIFTRGVDKGKAIFPYIEKIVEWDYKKPSLWEEHLKDKDAVIHLAGANISGKRWTPHYKKLIRESRIVSTRNLVKAMASSSSKPPVFISASGAGYYGDSGETEISENATAGTDFLAGIVKDWEHEAEAAQKHGIRTVTMRTGIVLSSEDGALKKMLLPFRFFVGGALGSGTQWFPWVHIDDVVEAYLFSLQNNNISGSVNVTAPQPVRMNEFAKAIGAVMKRPSFFKVPLWVLRIAVGEIADYLLYSQRLLPKKLLDQGFKFKYSEVKGALADLLK